MFSATSMSQTPVNRIPQIIWDQLAIEQQYQATQLIARLVYNWVLQQRSEIAHE